MDNLKKLLTDQTGMSEIQAGQAVEIVKKYVKDRVPGIIHHQLDKIFDGMSLEESFRNQMDDLGNEVREKTEGLARELKSVFESAFKTKKDNSNP